MTEEKKKIIEKAKEKPAVEAVSKEQLAGVKDKDTKVGEALTRDEAIGIKDKRERMRISREEKAKEEALGSWAPKTKIGMLVKNKKITELDDILINNKILEPEIIDTLVNLRTDMILIGQAKGKFGGGKRRAWRQTQRKTAEGNVPTFSGMAAVGDGKGHVGVGVGRSKETLPAREKALRKAKLNIIKIKRSCGSFDCACKEPHSIPAKVEGKCGSSRVVLIPAPQGTGLAAGDELKKILKLAGIKDVYSKTFGQTRTTLNLAKACIEALKKTNNIMGL